MGYTHYWYRSEELDAATFAAFAKDCGAIFKTATEAGFKLAGGLGDGDPEATDDRIWFNGAEACGHARRESELGIAWPAPKASGVETAENAIGGAWPFGALLSARTCSGDCSYETFGLERVTAPNPWQDATELVFACCKTAYRPYDVVVTAVLIAFKRHFGDAVRVSSDGGDADWQDGRILAQVAVGYGADFHLNATPDGERDLWGPSAASASRIRGVRS